MKNKDAPNADKIKLWEHLKIYDKKFRRLNDFCKKKFN